MIKTKVKMQHLGRNSEAYSAIRPTAAAVYAFG